MELTEQTSEMLVLHQVASAWGTHDQEGTWENFEWHRVNLAFTPSLTNVCSRDVTLLLLAQGNDVGEGWDFAEPSYIIFQSPRVHFQDSCQNLDSGHRRQ